MAEPAGPLSRQTVPTFFVTLNPREGGESIRECATRAEAVGLYDEFLRKGAAEAESASVYQAPSRALFDAHRQKAVQLVCVGVPKDHYDRPDVRERMAKLDAQRCSWCHDLVDDCGYAHCPSCGHELELAS